MPLTLRHARLLDLVTGQVAEPTDLHVSGDLLRRSAPERARVIDLDGGIVMPGLWDAHVHMNQWAACSRWVDVSAAGNAHHAAQIVGQALGDHRDEVLVGFGFRDSTWANPPTASDLDEVTGERPVVLISGDVHSVWLNSAAMARFGVSSGDGVLRETAAFELQQRLDQVSEDVMDEWVVEASQRAAERGVVGIVDMTMDWTIGHWQRRFDAGFHALCVRAGTYPGWLDRLLQEGLRGAQVLTDDRLLAVGPLKVITDGSLGSGTAWCHQPYGLQATTGRCSVNMDELTGLMHRAASVGLECAVHAIGDAAITQALDAFAETGVGGSIEHAQLVLPDDISRMAELGVRASVQPAHLLDDRDALDTLWPDRAEHAFPLASLQAAGVQLTLGSDAPVAPLDPWLAIEAAVRRARAEDEPWHPEQSLTLSEALLASCRGVRSLVPGAEADLVVLAENPFTLDTRELRGIRPLLTMVGGHLTHGFDSDL